MKTKPALTVDSPMWFGKHKGVPICRVPRDYLTWALAKADRVDDDQRRVLTEALGLPPGLPLAEDDTPAVNGSTVELDYLRRQLGKAEAKARKLEQELADLRAEAKLADRMTILDLDRVRAVVKQWFRAQSLLHHPDRGGSKERQALVNVAYQDLMKRLEGGGS